MICEFGDVVVVPFPFVDMPVVRRRPSLILSALDFNRAHGQSVLAMITTAARSAWPSDIPIADVTSVGLLQPSTIRFKLFTLPNDLITQKLGVLSRQDRAKVSRASRAILAA